MQRNTPPSSCPVWVLAIHYWAILPTNHDLKENRFRPLTSVNAGITLMVVLPVLPCNSLPFQGSAVKSPRQPLLSLLMLLICGCTTGHRPSDAEFGAVKVDMTYEEVERLLGKPSGIEKNIHQLDYDGLSFLRVLNSSDEMQFYQLQYIHEYSKATGDTSSYWFDVKKVVNKSNMVYVRWDYPITKQDTFWTVTASLADTNFNRPTKRSGKTPHFTRHFWAVENTKSVVFDATSGRVVDVRWTPISVSAVTGR